MTPQPQRKNINVLIIEDDFLARKNLKMTINRIYKNIPGKINYNEATNEKEANDLIKEHNYELIILDGELENENHGRNILRNLDNLQKQKTIIYSNDLKFCEEGKQEGIKSISKKPIYQPVLEKLIKEII